MAKDAEGVGGAEAETLVAGSDAKGAQWFGGGDG